VQVGKVDLSKPAGTQHLQKFQLPCTRTHVTQCTTPHPDGAGLPEANPDRPGNSPDVPVIDAA
jgi:hypothetical protein